MNVTHMIVACRFCTICSEAGCHPQGGRDQSKPNILRSMPSSPQSPQNVLKIRHQIYSGVTPNTYLT